MRIAIAAFAPGEGMPERFSREGGNCSPAVAFRDVPTSARSLVLIMDDPDAPRGLFTHWVVYNIDPSLGAFHENQVPETATQGRNSWNETRYGGPQPPDREHRYFLHLYALDALLPLEPGVARADVERAMRGHVIAAAEYMGRYAPHHAGAGRG